MSKKTAAMTPLDCMDASVAGFVNLSKKKGRDTLQGKNHCLAHVRSFRLEKVDLLRDSCA